MLIPDDSQKKTKSNVSGNLELQKQLLKRGERGQSIRMKAKLSLRSRVRCFPSMVFAAEIYMHCEFS